MGVRYVSFASTSDGAVEGNHADKLVGLNATSGSLALSGASGAACSLTNVNNIGAATASFSGVVTASTTPTQDGHLANKAYVDSVTQGLNAKDSVKLASTANVDGDWDSSGATTTLTLTQAGAGNLNIDGTAVVNGNRVL